MLRLSSNSGVKDWIGAEVFQSVKLGTAFTESSEFASLSLVTLYISPAASSVYCMHDLRMLGLSYSYLVLEGHWLCMTRNELEKTCLLEVLGMDGHRGRWDNWHALLCCCQNTAWVWLVLVCMQAAWKWSQKPIGKAMAEHSLALLWPGDDRNA